MAETRTYGRRRQLLSKTAEATPATPPATREAVSGRVVSTSSGGSTQMAGWDAMDRTASASGSDMYLKVTEEAIVIKVLGDGPFDVYNSHWVDEIEDGSKSVRCWATPDCPLCRVGDKAKRFSACFDVVSLEDPDTPVMKVWEAGIKVARQLKDIATDAKRGPLNRDDLYFTIRKEQKKKSVEYTLERVKERDLYEEYDVEPLGEEILRAFLAEAHEWGAQVKEPLDEDGMNEVVDLLVEG
ncbi:hypothetical protein [Streptomyces malaysiensis]|uniref:Uncharacterized protein n=1 Tax=Streptomyces malaysiensis TaxID=92644 RepID=A0A7X5X7K6_STRMQ|nr:hypothetical protein [Streptomyces malaysiensis]NIY68027.1 hypothetical protein [Streptomyces malaysiensis]